MHVILDIYEKGSFRVTFKSVICLLEWNILNEPVYFWFELEMGMWRKQ